MTLHLIDPTDEGSTLRAAAFRAENDLHDLSARAGGLAALLDLVACNKDRFDAPESKAIYELATIAKHIECEINAIMGRLENARSPAASIG